jgi:hypothetical protein
VLTVAAVQSPTLLIPQEEAGPPEAIIPILLMPRAPPPAPGAQAPSPIRLHQRALRAPPESLPVAPLAVPVTPPTPVPPPPPGPVTLAPSPAEAQQKTDVRAALQGLVGCADPDAAGLTQAQRQKCQERLAANAKNTPFVGLGLASDKLKDLDVTAAHKEACRTYRATVGGEQPRLRDGAC